LRQLGREPTRLGAHLPDVALDFSDQPCRSRAEIPVGAASAAQRAKSEAVNQFLARVELFGAKGGSDGHRGACERNVAMSAPPNAGSSGRHVDRLADEDVEP
jgi:hypothetical protein